MFSKSPAAIRLQKKLQPFLDRVESQIREEARQFDPGVEGYVEYVLDSSGKRIRPTLALLAGGAVDGNPQSDHHKLGVILELIHIASLVHDDIMDGAKLRRQMPTACARWGNTLSVLLGDSLFAHALMLASEFDDTTVSRRISRAARDVCTGEVLQTQRRFDLNLDRDSYRHIIEMKTASLFACATEVAAYFSGASDTLCAAMKDYGLLLGTAYQIYDDCLDLVGDEAVAGKTLRTDLAKGKLTLPVINLMDRATPAQRDKINRLLLKGESLDTTILAGIADYEGAVEEAIESARGMLEAARGNLIGLDASDYRDGLEGVTRYVDALLKSCCDS